MESLKFFIYSFLSRHIKIQSRIRFISWTLLNTVVSLCFINSISLSSLSMFVNFSTNLPPRFKTLDMSIIAPSAKSKLPFFGLTIE